MLTPTYFDGIQILSLNNLTSMLDHWRRAT